MEAIMNFLREVFTKIEVVIPTLITLLGSSSGIIIYKFAKLLANLSILKSEIVTCKNSIRQLENLIDNQKKAIEERDAIINDIIETNPNQRLKKSFKERMQVFTKLDTYNQKVNEDNLEPKKKKIKIKRIKKA